MIEIPEYLLGSKEPFIICSRSVLQKQLGVLRDMGLEVFYSVKTNPEQVILHELRDFGTGFSTAGQEEFLLLMSMGIRPERIYHYERALTKERVKRLIGLGCKNFVVESRKAFDNIIEEIGRGFSLLLRIMAKPADNRYAGDYVPGFDIGEVNELVERCKARGIESGILHHSSSQMDDPMMWRSKFEELLAIDAKIDVDTIDIGGGLPVDYTGHGCKKVIDEIKRGIKRFGKKRLIAEPGRFIVGPACSLVARVELVDGQDVVVNCSVYDVHIDTIIAGLILPCRVPGRSLGERKKIYRILGSSLCNLDVFNPSVKLPEVSEGDIIVFDKAGAYNISSNFSSGGKIKTYIVD